jgi:hypothetical protein
MTTSTIIDTVDFKGLSAFEVQRAIDTYLKERELASLRASWRAREEAQKQATRERVAKRAKVANAVKRAGVPVRTESDSWRSNKADITRTPDSDGWFIVSLPRDTRLVYLSRLQDSPELELKTIVEKSQYSVLGQSLAELTYIRLTPKEA